MMTLREIILQLLGIITSAAAAIILLILIATGTWSKPDVAGLAFLMAWVCGLQCGELFK